MSSDLNNRFREYFESNIGEQAVFQEELKILLVDDTRVNLILTSKIIEQILPNAKIYLANSGDEALDTYETHPDIDLVFMDLFMPEMDGYETTLQIFEMYEKKPLIVALTVDNSLEGIEKVKAYGLKGLISKPVTKQELINLFKKLNLIN
jgi:CheY-like chemotaxis protein